MDESDEKSGGDEKMDESDEMDESDGDDEGGEKNEAAAAAAAAPEGQELQDRQPNSWSGDTLQKTSGAKFNLTLNQWVTDTIDAEENGRCEELLRSQVGAPITEGNVDDVNKLVLRVATQIPKVDEKGLTPAEKKEHDRLKDGVQGFEAKSYLGNLFSVFAKTQEEQEKYKNCATRVDQATFRIEWAKGQLPEFEKKRVYRRARSRVDTTQGAHKSFAKLVVDLGGWKSKEALSGAINCAQKCLRLGAPWIQVHLPDQPG